MVPDAGPAPRLTCQARVAGARVAVLAGVASVLLTARWISSDKPGSDFVLPRTLRETQRPVTPAQPTQTPQGYPRESGRSASSSSFAFLGMCAACGVQIVSRVTRSGKFNRKPSKQTDWNHPRLGYRIKGAPGWNGSPHTWTDPIRWVHRFRRRIHIRRKVEGTPARPRLAIYRSHMHMHASVIDDTHGTGITMVQVTSKQTPSLEKLREKQGCEKGGEKTWSVEAAEIVGEEIAKQCLDKGITMVVFDRGGFRYEGRVKALAEAARSGGLQF
ncbi:unnamed protein product [Effrenium voratum]|nr:unnamed protein product [Effrenium voratum]